MLDTLKRPLVAVAAETMVPVGTWVIFTVAPESASPLVDLTVPAIEEVVTWEKIEPVTIKLMAKMKNDFSTCISSCLGCKIIEV